MHGETECYGEGLVWLCCQQAVKTSLPLGLLFIYYLYLAYLQNRLEVAFNKNH